jgi:hypothetical protein
METNTETTVQKPVIIVAEIRRWFDKVNGVSYFAARGTATYADGSQRVTISPFESGYGSHPEFELCRKMKAEGIIPESEPWRTSLYSSCTDQGIKLQIVDTDVKKRDCKF